MKTVIDTPLPRVGAPFEWAVACGGILYTAQVPIRADGTIENGPAEQQVRLTFDNLEATLAAAGAGLDDVTQVMVFMTDAAHLEALNAIYPDYFRPPFPNRATLIVAGLPLPGTVIEIVAYAHMPA